MSADVDPFGFLSGMRSSTPEEMEAYRRMMERLSTTLVSEEELDILKAENAVLKEERDGFEAFGKLKEAQFNNVLGSVEMLKSANDDLCELLLDTWHLLQAVHSMHGDDLGVEPRMASLSVRMKRFGLDVGYSKELADLKDELRRQQNHEH